MTDSTEWTLRNEIEAQERRLLHFCNLVNAGKAQGGGREFYRQIGHAFDNIKAALNEQNTRTPKETEGD